MRARPGLLVPSRSHPPAPFGPRPPVPRNPPIEVTIIGKKPGQSVDKRRREREKIFKMQEKAARKAARLEENARRKAAGEDYPLPATPDDLEADEEPEQERE